MESTYEVKDLAAQPVLSVRTTTQVEQLPMELGRIFGAIAQLLCEMNEQPGGMPFVAYYNMDMQALEVEVGFPVQQPLPGKGEIECREIPAGKYASTLYVGPYEEMAPAYDSMNQWLAEHGYEPTGITYEYYLNGPDTATPQEYQTRIVFPLK